MCTYEHGQQDSVVKDLGSAFRNIFGGAEDYIDQGKGIIKTIGEHLGGLGDTVETAVNDGYHLSLIHI